MNRKCMCCSLNGIKVGRIVPQGPPRCEICGTQYRVARYQNLPYLGAGAVAAVFLFAWLTGSINVAAFIVLCGVWLILDFIWEYLVPLEPADNGDSGQAM